MTSPIKVIINSGSGKDQNTDELKAQIIELFAAKDLNAEIFVAENGEEIFGFTEKAVKSDAEIIVAGGGDGSVSAVASKLVNTEKTLGVLPLGTLNNFSKDLQIPPDLAEAVNVIAENHVKKVDVAEVNGKIFINNSSIGLYPNIVKHREQQQEKLGRSKWSAAFWAALKILRRHPFFIVKLKNEKGERVVKTPFVFVGNNEYEMDFLKVGRREYLDKGSLSVYFLEKSGRKGLFALALRLVFGRLRQAKDFEAINVEEITIETKKKQILVAFDGEVEMMKTPLCYCIHPLALRVIVPKKIGENFDK